MEITNNLKKSLEVMYNVSCWMRDVGLNLSKWWRPENMNKEFLLQYTEPDEFFVALSNKKPAASVVLQETDRNQSWKIVDGEKTQKALYLHWLCVHRDFAGRDYSKKMINIAKKEAKRRDLKMLRLDTGADGTKLCEMYESFGFKRVGIDNNGNHPTAFYQISV